MSAARATTVAGSMGASGAMQASAPELTFSFVISASATRGKNSAVVFAMSETGEWVSDKLEYIVEDDSSIVGLKVSSNRITFDYSGDRVTLQIYGLDPEGKTINIRKSTHLQVLSNDESVARWTGSSIIAYGPGTTSIIVNYRELARKIPIIVRNPIPGDLNNDGDVDSSDLSSVRAWLGRSAVGPNDARDLDRSGKIDAGDEAALIALCTRRRCAINSAENVAMIPDTTPPQVTLTSPAAGSTVWGPITLSADASDDDLLAAVYFLINGEKLEPEISSPPYETEWNSRKAGRGEYTLKAVARDDYGNITESDPVQITVDSGGGSDGGDGGGEAEKNVSQLVRHVRKTRLLLKAMQRGSVRLSSPGNKKCLTRMP